MATVGVSESGGQLQYCHGIVGALFSDQSKPAQLLELNTELNGEAYSSCKACNRDP